jgi:hypothetical protein
VIRARRRTSVAAVARMLLIAGCGLLAACGSSSPSDDTSSGTTPPPGPGLPEFDREQTLPPNDVGSLRNLYDRALAPLGVRLTRGALVDTSNDRYVPSNTGRHLALYVEPIADYSEEQYLEGFWTVSALITPDVFARWPDLESYDICQEPLPAVNDEPEPFPLTQINLTRAAASRIDWEDGDVVDLLVASRSDPDVKVVVNRDLRENPAYAAADAAARARTGSG